MSLLLLYPFWLVFFSFLQGRGLFAKATLSWACDTAKHLAPSLSRSMNYPLVAPPTLTEAPGQVALACGSAGFVAGQDNPCHCCPSSSLAVPVQLFPALLTAAFPFPLLPGSFPSAVSCSPCAGGLVPGGTACQRCHLALLIVSLSLDS